MSTRRDRHRRSILRTHASLGSPSVTVAIPQAGTSGTNDGSGTFTPAAPVPYTVRTFGARSSRRTVDGVESETTAVTLFAEDLPSEPEWWRGASIRFADDRPDLPILAPRDSQPFAGSPLLVRVDVEGGGHV